ncbi:hypothetical protein OIU84_004548 [Salix udensis]|uniref:Uncharacterized protein n=1 Tax=Salix udensis TaxID=889485 RepID=A0AAD6K2G8_9ROSI|nr:hypothetical protein OIU84_004548 [Salix udensis]
MRRSVMGSAKALSHSSCRNHCNVLLLRPFASSLSRFLSSTSALDSPPAPPSMAPVSLDTINPKALPLHHRSCWFFSCLVLDFVWIFHLFFILCY